MTSPPERAPREEPRMEPERILVRIIVALNFVPEKNSKNDLFETMVL